MTDEVVLITGAGSGIGATVAERFAAEGAAVVVADIDAPAGAAVAGRLPRGLAVATDVSQREQVAAAFEQARRAYGDVTIVVNNAMSVNDADFLDQTDAQWDRDLAVNLKGPMLVTQLALPAMLARGRGVIINVSSVNGVEYLGNESYSACKAGLVSFTKSMAVRYGRDGIRCNAVAPGTIVTPTWDARLAADPTVLDTVAQWYPSPRLGTPDDIAAAILFLASDDAGWVNGATLTVDGGLTAGKRQMALDIVAGPAGSAGSTGSAGSD